MEFSGVSLDLGFDVEQLAIAESVEIAGQVLPEDQRCAVSARI